MKLQQECCTHPLDKEIEEEEKEKKKRALSLIIVIMMPFDEVLMKIDLC